MIIHEGMGSTRAPRVPTGASPVGPSLKAVTKTMATPLEYAWSAGALTTAGEGACGPHLNCTEKHRMIPPTGLSHAPASATLLSDLARERFLAVEGNPTYLCAWPRGVLEALPIG